MASGSPAWLRQFLDRVVASDPGWNRFRMALSGVLSVGVALVVEYGLARLLGLGSRGVLISMLLGAVVSMMGSMALTGSGVWSKVRTAAFFPVAIGLGMAVGTLTAHNRALQLTVFVVVMFLAVFVRRFGMAFFFYGFMGWMGYFFAAFLKASPAQLPILLLAVVVGTVCLLLLSMTVLRVHTGRTLRRTLRAFRSRGRAVAATGADILAADDPDEGPWRRLRGRQVRLAEAALMVEGWLGEQGATPPGWSAAALRRQLIDAQLAVEGIAAAVPQLTRAPSGVREAATRVMRALAAGDQGAAVHAARELRARADAESGSAARQLAASAQDFVAIVRHWASAESGTASGGETEGFEPAVTLAMGNLPGSAAVAKDVSARGAHWNPLSRLDLNTRQAIQVTVAGALAILVGQAVSPTRYYWAAIAAFVAFTGASTRFETFIKSFNRVLGTLAGLFVAIALARLTAGHTYLIIAVILACLFCGFYLMRVSYALMIFFITIMLAQLYTVLNQLSDQVMLLRLEETAIGAGIGIAVSLVVIPLSTKDTVRSARANFFADLAVLLRAAAHRLGVPGESENEEEGDPDGLARVLDHRLQQTNMVAAPLMRQRLAGSDSRRLRHRVVLYTVCASYARELAAVLRRVEADPRPDGTGRACRYLAAVASELVEHRPGQDTSEIDRNLYLAARALQQRTTPTTEPVRHALSRLHQVLYQLATASEVAASPYLIPDEESDEAEAPVRAERPAASEPRDTALHGSVQGGNGEPLPRAVITLIGTHGQQVRRTEVDEEGSYAFPELPPEAVTMVATAAGFASEATFAPTTGAGEQRHDFTLSPTPVRRA
ncbi:hypothetical protein FHX42_004171 [Saccharopolyspora lacisalsi]|uniref:Integral membrane bound transporter domain-containing protein n=1 Tax=Halosaccharopolyspora lacisalsi TaxID=1000566 RepID=A0A839DXV3_9PSEU|nr:FUSC family protein [Halosaccharopolyspora lacisalsi]MBA8826792.1 hypothetical protein [Halosaccharopolyspora lacisalsi]